MEDGFYIVKYEGKWIVAEWAINFFWVTGSQFRVPKSDVDEIKEKVKLPE